MALKLVSRGNQPIQSKLPEQPGFLSDVGNTLKQVATGVALSPFQWAQNIGSALADIAPSRRGGRPELTRELYEGPSVTEMTREKLNIPKPEGFAQETLDLSAQNLPLTLLLGGGTIGQKILHDVLGSIGMKAAEKAGFGAAGQIAGALAAPGAFSKVAPKLAQGAKRAGFNKAAQFLERESTRPGLYAAIDKQEQNLFTKADELGSKITGPSHNYARKLEELKEEIGNTTKITESNKNDLISKFNLWISDIAGDRVNANKITERIKDINALHNEPLSDNYRRYLDRAQKIMFDEGDKLGKNHPLWHKAWSSAREITKAKNYQFSVRDMLEDYPMIGKHLKSKLAWESLGAGIGYGLGGKLGGVAGIGLAQVPKNIERLYGFYSYPAAQKTLYKVFKSAIDENKDQFLKSIVKLNKVADDYEKENPEQTSRLRLISRATK